ncbi:HIT family protein [Parasedimentitalea marina]|uniref:HIT family protein n=1 Tax=Parasedimentitalea marina TaxID=2483033 RepID=A0A3T0N0F0_9RHOB|nr:HIT family protein [Parasedimentitalea marina]AZV77491.1 HIT family protein [Parasedimentitalea marina]
MQKPCLFCRIAHSVVASHEVFRNDRLVAFLDIGPIRPEHVQIIPIAHYDYFENLPKDIAQEIMLLGQSIARCQKSLLGVERVAFLFTGGDIPHAHCHLVPMVENTDITSARYIEEKELTFMVRPNPGETSLREMALWLSAELQVQDN